MKRIIQRLIGAILLALAALAVARSSFAHALLVRSLPAAGAEVLSVPATVEMWFSEPLEPEFSSARLLDGLGREQASGAASIDPNDPTHLSLPLGLLQADVYTVAWQTLSQVDGHESRGSFTFTVLYPDGSTPAQRISERQETDYGLPTPWEGAARWAGLTGALLLLGLPVFARAAVVSASEPGGVSTHSLRQTWAEIMERLVILAAVLVVIGTWSGFILQASALGRLSLLPQLLFNTRIGALGLARQAAALTAVVVCVSWRLDQRSPGRQQLLSLGAVMALVIAVGSLVASAENGQIWIAAFGILTVLTSLVLEFGDEPGKGQSGSRFSMLPSFLPGMAIGFTYSLGSHAAAARASLWGIGADFLHLAAAGIWFSGLLGLALLSRRMRDGSELDEKIALGGSILRFSWIASLSLFVLVLTGVLSAAIELGVLPALWETSYGLTLIIKLLLFVIVLGVAFLNNRTVHGRLASLSSQAGLRRFGRRVAVEWLILTAVIVAVGFLVQTPPPVSYAPDDGRAMEEQPFSTLVEGGNFSFHLIVTPDRVGENRFTVHLYTPDVSPIGEVQLVRLTLRPPRSDIGEASLDLIPEGLDTYSAEKVYLSLEGDWEASLYVRRRGMDDAILETNFPVRSPNDGAAAAPNWASPIPGVPLGFVLSAAFLAIAVIPWIWRPLFERLLPGLGASLRIIGLVLAIAALLLFGWTLAFAGQRADQGGSTPVQNFVPRTNRTIRLGEELYVQECLACHGPRGLGDGPLGRVLNPPPANLQVHMIAGVHSDEQLFEWIQNGYPDSPMPAFADKLSDDQIWYLVYFIRTLAPEE